MYICFQLWNSDSKRKISVNAIKIPNASICNYVVNRSILLWLAVLLQISRPAVAILDAHSAPDRRARVRDSRGEIPPCALMAPGACKIRRECNVLQVPFQNYTSGGTKAGELSPPWKIKIVMACLRTILRDDKPSAIAHCVALVGR